MTQSRGDNIFCGHHRRTDPVKKTESWLLSTLPKHEIDDMPQDRLNKIVQEKLQTYRPVATSTGKGRGTTSGGQYEENIQKNVREAIPLSLNIPSHQPQNTYGRRNRKTIERYSPSRFSDYIIEDDEEDDEEDISSEEEGDEEDSEFEREYYQEDREEQEYMKHNDAYDDNDSIVESSDSEEEISSSSYYTGEDSDFDEISESEEDDRYEYSSGEEEDDESSSESEQISQETTTEGYSSSSSDDDDDPPQRNAGHFLAQNAALDKVMDNISKESMATSGGEPEPMQRDIPYEKIPDYIQAPPPPQERKVHFEDDDDVDYSSYLTPPGNKKKKGKNHFEKEIYTKVQDFSWKFVLSFIQFIEVKFPKFDLQGWKKAVQRNKTNYYFFCKWFDQSVPDYIKEQITPGIILAISIMGSAVSVRAKNQQKKAKKQTRQKTNIGSTTGRQRKPTGMGMNKTRQQQQQGQSSTARRTYSTYTPVQQPPAPSSQFESDPIRPSQTAIFGLNEKPITIIHPNSLPDEEVRTPDLDEQREIAYYQQRGEEEEEEEENNVRDINQLQQFILQ